MSIYQMRTPLKENAETTAMLLQFGLGISEVTAGLLVNRGITELEQAKSFLNPSLDQLHDPFLLSGMEKAEKRIRQAVNTGERITIYGDYDADGITSSSLLSLYLKSQGAIVDVYIPSRQEEGYGLHMEALQKIRDQGTGLVITVDCGISALEEAGEFQQWMDIIITDHHNPGPELPAAYAVVNPKIIGQAYPFKELAGVGVAAKLVQALAGVEGLLPYLDLIAVGTIADIVPLTDENRVFAALGIQQINESPRPGIEALLQALNMQGKDVDAGRISYSIGPCLNAPGRMTTFHAGYELLTADNLHTAQPLAVELVEQNQLRKEAECRTLESAGEMLLKQVDLAYDRVIVVAREGWHPGVIGIVASRLTEQYNRPSIVLSTEGDQAVGSARSISGYHLYDALAACSELLIRFGGHEMAAGLSIRTEDIDEFRKCICAHAAETLDEAALIPRYFHDGQLRHEQITPGLLNEIDKLAPFGCGNPAPRFYLPSALVENSRLIGKDLSHLKLVLSLGQRSWDAVGFGMAETGKDIQQGSHVSLLTSLKRNEWMGISSTQLQIYSMERAYRGIMDVEELLSSFHFKFFDVFFRHFMYNDNDAFLTAVQRGLGANDGQALPVLSLDETISLLQDSMVGTAVFVSTLEIADILLKRLMKADLLDKIPVHYHHPNSGSGPGRNTVILIPDCLELPDRYYHTLIIPKAEEGFHRAWRERSAWQKQRKYCHLLADHMAENRGIRSEDYTLTRDQMGVLYKWLRRIVPGRNIWTDSRNLLRDAIEGSGIQWNGFQLCLALEIFRELNFITVKSENQCIWIQCNRSPENRQLDESRLVNFHRKWLACHGISDNMR